MNYLTGLYFPSPYWHSNGTRGNNFVHSLFRVDTLELGHGVNDFVRLQISPKKQSPRKKKVSKVASYVIAKLYSIYYILRST